MEGVIEDPIERTRTGIVLRVRVKPRASRDEITGTGPRGVLISVRAAPEKGKANAAVLKVLARRLSVPQRALTIASGEGARDKRILVEGLNVDEVRARLGI